MIGAYLIVGGVLGMVAGYVALMNYLLNRVDRRDLAALASAQTKPASECEREFKRDDLAKQMVSPSLPAGA